MFKHLATSIFQRRHNDEASRSDKAQMTQSELQDLFRNDLEVHNLSAVEITLRNAERRPHAFAA